MHHVSDAESDAECIDLTSTSEMFICFDQYYGWREWLDSGWIQQSD